MRLLATALAFAYFFSIAAWADAPTQTMLGEWQDTTRSNRVVPYKIYYSPQAQGARPVVIFSHGLGGSRDGAEYLLSYLAANGYIVIAVQHPGSDTPAVFGGAGPGGGVDREKIEANLQQAMSPGVAADRFRDIPFAISMLAQMNAQDATLRGRLDLERIGLSGHSYGGITTQALMGQRFPLNISFTDPRIKAAIIYSPSKPRRDDASAFADVRIPSFHMTGTEDGSPLPSLQITPEDRLVPYNAIKTADKYLLVLAGGDHMVFSGRRRGEANPKDDRWHEIVQRASLVFWDAYLLNKPEAKTYLTGGAFARDLGQDGRYEFVLR